MPLKLDPSWVPEWGLAQLPAGQGPARGPLVAVALDRQQLFLEFLALILKASMKFPVSPFSPTWTKRQLSRGIFVFLFFGTGTQTSDLARARQARWLFTGNPVSQGV